MTRRLSRRQHWGLYRRHDLAAVRAAHDGLTTLAAAGVAVPLIGARLPMEQVPEGLTALAAGDTVGRLVVEH